MLLSRGSRGFNGAVGEPVLAQYRLIALFVGFIKGVGFIK